MDYARHANQEQEVQLILSRHTDESSLHVDLHTRSLPSDVFYITAPAPGQYEGQ